MERMNVSSIVVKTTPERLREVIDHINTLDFCEVHFFDPAGKIVATIDGETIHDQMESMKKIQGLPDVFSVNLSYSYCEEEVAGAIDEMNSLKEDGI